MRASRLEPRYLHLSIAIVVLNSSAAICSSQDKAQEAEIVGTWSTAQDVGDPVERMAEQLHLFGLEIFRKDGSGTNLIFAGKMCGQIVAQRAFSWSIKSGALISILPNGMEVHDKIMGLDHKELFLRSLDDGTTSHRIRHIGCTPDPALIKPQEPGQRT